MIRGMTVLPSAAAPAFTPLSLSNLRFWLDFTDGSKMLPPGVVDGTPVTQITDKSTNAYAFTAPLNQQPLYKTGIQNSNACLLWDGVNDYFTCNLGTDLTIVNMFFAGKATTSRAFNTICGSNVLDSTQINWEQGTAGQQLDAYAGGVKGPTGAGTFPNNTFQTAYLTYTSGTGVIGVNNTALGSFNTTGLRFEATNFIVGYDGTGAGFFDWNGYMGDLICGTGSIWTATELLNLYNWAKAKYNI